MTASMGAFDREVRPVAVEPDPPIAPAQRTTTAGQTQPNGSHDRNGNGAEPHTAALATETLAPPALGTKAPSLPRTPRRRPSSAARSRTVRPVALSPAAEPEADERPQRWQRFVVPGALAIVVMVALLMRIAGARTFTPQADEPASILAAHQIAEKGVPVLPSGTLYLHGATLSYLLTPFVWAGYGDLNDLTAMRMVSVFFGVVAVVLTYFLTRLVAGASWIGILAAFLLAIDPISVEWGSLARMYSVFQATTTATILLFLLVLVRKRSNLMLAGLVACFWLSIFSHLGAALIWPGMVAISFATYGKDFFRERRDLISALAVCLVAPLAISAMNSILQPKNYRTDLDSSFFSFAGEGLFSTERITSPRITAWDALFGRGNMSSFLPFVFVILCGALIGSLFLKVRAGNRARGHREGARLDAVLNPGERDRRIMTGAVLTIYWGAVLAICLFTVEQKPRYLLHVHPLTWVLFALGVALLIQQSGLATRNVSLFHIWQRWLPQTVAGALAVVLVIYVLGGGLNWRFFRPIIDSDHIGGVEYVAANREPGDLVIAALPAPAYLEFGGGDDLMFMAGAEGTNRINRYTRLDADGRTIDYWAGVDSIVSTPQLCSVLTANPNAWIIVDEDRLTEIWAFSGPMRETVLRMTDLVAELDGGVQIYHRVQTPGSSGNRTCGNFGGVPAEFPAPITFREREG
jgi:hypothetical protein